MHRLTGARPIEITENGASDNARPQPDHHIHDADRIACPRSHLREVSRAIAMGVPIRGHRCWSLLDDFAWVAGYSQRFGLAYVDFPNDLTRQPNGPFQWYRGIVASIRGRRAAGGLRHVE